MFSSPSTMKRIKISGERKTGASVTTQRHCRYSRRFGLKTGGGKTIDGRASIVQGPDAGNYTTAAGATLRVSHRRANRAGTGRGNKGRIRPRDNTALARRSVRRDNRKVRALNVVRIFGHVPVWPLLSTYPVIFYRRD